MAFASQLFTLYELEAGICTGSDLCDVCYLLGGVVFSESKITKDGFSLGFHHSCNGTSYRF